MRRRNVIKNVIEMDNSVNKEGRVSLVHRILQMIDNKCNDEFFMHMIKKVIVQNLGLI